MLDNFDTHNCHVEKLVMGIQTSIKEELVISIQTWFVPSIQQKIFTKWKGIDALVI